jgi:hypothetical protein
MKLDGNHIAEICAELVPYGILIKIDHLLRIHSTEIARKELEAAFWQLLRTLQSSSVLRSGNTTIQKIDRMYTCLDCKYSTIFKSESEEHVKLTGHKAKSIPFTPEWERY